MKDEVENIDRMIAVTLVIVSVGLLIYLVFAMQVCVKRTPFITMRDLQVCFGR